MSDVESEAALEDQTEPHPVYLVGELARLEVKPGDRLVVKLKKRLSPADMRLQLSVFQEWAGPDVKVIVIEPWISLGVISTP